MGPGHKGVVGSPTVSLKCVSYIDMVKWPTHYWTSAL